MKTAEWICEDCGTTNRKLVAPDATVVQDRCVHCHKVHVIEEADRPVRWAAKLKS
jgi:hypothetical protein